MQPRPQVTVSVPALLQRINRALAHRGQHLYCTHFRSRAINDLGRWYITDLNRVVTATPQDIDTLGRELRVLRAHEVAADE